MTTYPSGTISIWGTNQALTNQNTWISYKGVDGSIFYLAGPLAPMPGAQNGVVLTKHMGMMSPFEHLELRGARQDGATWTDAVYEVGDIMLGLEASGTDPQSIRNVIRQWVSAWDPKQTGTLSVFTPDMGEWWAKVRLGKSISDPMSKDYTWSGRQPLTWSCKNYDSFWYGVDSTSSFSILYDAAGEGFQADANNSTLNATRWDQFYSTGAGGTFGTINGAAQFETNNVSVPVTWTNIWKTDVSATDNQVVSVRLSGPSLANLFRPLDPGAAFDIWARADGTGNNGIRLRCGWAFGRLSYFVAGVEHLWAEFPMIIQPFWGETYTLIVGTDAGPRNVIVQRDGFTIMNINDTAAGSHMGSSYRHWGFGGETAIVPALGWVVTPPPIDAWFASDNLGSTQSGYVYLTNMGDVDGWPRYLCYGPGTFSFGNGPNATDMITFGPLLQGQVVLITTEPRLRSVVDITPGQPPPPGPGIFRTLINDLISFALNHNVPPLLQQFESFFGILPPQGNLFSLLTGRFTVPLPPATYGSPLTTSHIPVSITNGGPTSKIVASVTPRRRWPL